MCLFFKGSVAIKSSNTFRLPISETPTAASPPNSLAISLRANDMFTNFLPYFSIVQLFEPVGENSLSRKESVLKGYSLVNVPENKELRSKYADYSLQALTQILESYKTLHNKTDVDTVQRAIRAIEIEEYKKAHSLEQNEFPPLNSLVIGVDIDRELRRKKISDRLKARLEDGMIEEIKDILSQEVKPEDLIYYGLEYKYVTLYILGQLSYEDMY